MNPSTFAECFCAQNNLKPEQFARAVLRRSLYPRARVFKWLLLILNRHHFEADFDFIYGVAPLRRVRDFVPEAERFNEHPANHGFLRRTLGLRVSTKRLKSLMRETLPRVTEPVRAGAGGEPGAESSTVAPFEARSVAMRG